MYQQMIFLIVMAQGHTGVTVTRRLWIRYPLEGMNYYLLMFSFLCSGTKAPGVEFRHSTQNASKNSAKRGERSVLTLSSLPLPTIAG